MKRRGLVRDPESPWGTVLFLVCWCFAVAAFIVYVVLP